MDSMDTSENDHQHESVASLAKRFEKLAKDLDAQNNVNGFVDNGLCQGKTNQGTKSPTVQLTNANDAVEANTYLENKSFGNIASCRELHQRRSNLPNGYYEFKTLQGYCDLTNNGWTLIARFSNGDVKHWMINGSFWYDKETAYGECGIPSHSTDMISPSFWNVKGDEFKITRSDDSSHKALLQTTSSCLQGVPFRSKITSYGIFHNGTEWASNQCLGKCEVIYSAGDQYKATAGFGWNNCSGDLQSGKYIGFWCDWKLDSAVMMIGGGGEDCNRADHGIGITERNLAMFGGEEDYYDFGDIANYKSNAPSSYSLNLWVR